METPQAMPHETPSDHMRESPSGRGMRLFDPDRAHRIMSDAGLDLLMPHTQINAGYLADYYNSNSLNWPFYTTETGLPYLQFVGLPVDPSSQPFLLATTSGNAMDVGYFDPWIKDRYVYGDPEPYSTRVAPSKTWRPVTSDAIRATVAALNDRRLTEATIGVELPFLGASVLAALQSALPGARFVDGLPALHEMRMIKTSEEIRRLEVAAGLTRQAHVMINAQIREGMTGQDIDRVIRSTAAALNADLDFREIHPNRGMALMFAPTDGVLTKHEAISIDLGFKYLGYGSDMAHNHSLGRPSPATSDLHRSMQDALLAAITAARPGVKCSAVYTAATRVLEAAGVQMIYRMVGHGLGRHVHEPPYLKANDHTPIETGMVFAFELPMWTSEAGWVQIEENYVIEGDGPRWLAPGTLAILTRE